MSKTLAPVVGEVDGEYGLIDHAVFVELRDEKMHLLSGVVSAPRSLRTQAQETIRLQNMKILGRIYIDEVDICGHRLLGRCYGNVIVDDPAFDSSRAVSYCFILASGPVAR